MQETTVLYTAKAAGEYQLPQQCSYLDKRFFLENPPRMPETELSASLVAGGLGLHKFGLRHGLRGPDEVVQALRTSLGKMHTQPIYVNVVGEADSAE